MPKLQTYEIKAICEEIGKSKKYIERNGFGHDQEERLEGLQWVIETLKKQEEAE